MGLSKVVVRHVKNRDIEEVGLTCTRLAGHIESLL